MEIPSEVLIHNSTLGLKGTEGRLLQVSSLGFYEVECDFGQATHRLLLPISSTVIISKDVVEELVDQIEVLP